MWKSNLVVALRVLWRHKLITVINVAGLSAAMAVAVMFERHETRILRFPLPDIDTPELSTLAGRKACDVTTVALSHRMEIPLRPFRLAGPSHPDGEQMSSVGA